MKRNIIAAVLILCLASLAVAQTPQDRETLRNRRNWQQPEPITLTGSMIVANGRPAFKSGDITYYISGVNQLIGFVDGFKEGAQVTVEGRAYDIPRTENVKFLMTSKITIAGKSYDIAPLFQGMNAPGLQNTVPPNMARDMWMRPNPPAAPWGNFNRPQPRNPRSGPQMQNPRYYPQPRGRR